MTQMLAKVKKIIYFSPNNNFFVLSLVEVTKTFKEEKNEFTVTSTMGPFTKGEVYNFMLEYELTTKYGYQFVVKAYNHIMSNSITGIAKFIVGMDISGVGEVRSKLIVNRLGVDFFKKEEFRREDFESLGDFLRVDQIDALYTLLAQPKIYDDIRLNLLSVGLSSKMITKLITKFGERTLHILQNDPYIIIDELPGVGFIKADEIAKRIGIAIDSIYRLKAAMLYIMKEIHNLTGDSYVLINDIIERFIKIIEIEILDHEVIMDMLIKDNKVIKVDDKFYLAVVYNTEKSLSNIIFELANYSNKTQIEVDNIYHELSNFEKNSKITFTITQKNAIINSLTSKFSIITGSPGTGKTTIAKAILEIFLRLGPKDAKSFAICAPTGRAAKRISEVINTKAQTIHSLIGIKEDGSPMFGPLEPLPCDFLIVDETSMLDLYLAHLLFRALRKDTKVLLIGDVDQLPPIAPGHVLSDLIFKAKITTTYLTEIIRQEENSNIIKLSKQVLAGSVNFYDIKGSDVEIYKLEALKIQEWLGKYYIKYLEANSHDSIMVLGPKRAGIAGNDKLNQYLQNILIQNKDHKVVNNSRIFYLKDKVIHTKNNYRMKVMNGEVGYVCSIYNNSDDALGVKFDGIEKCYTLEDLNELELAYALSVHKAQGSESKTIILVVTSDAKFMLNKQLLYTAITRAKEKLVILGEPGLLHYYSKRQATSRKTTLFDPHYLK